eukprot:TRINITY_DN54_c0_g2_i3.p1 TRINITY_DN54_c0_g2~~TRINITY_DN54_c0_g2_i3.p1  ORF type:complete len:454 (-),score=64.88 TRINITY_DN54_c0_g2_i3:13578-14939(-)
MSAVEPKKEIVNFVNAVGAVTLPSPARRCLLQFNPFLDIERLHPYRVVAYNSQGKFQRVVMEGSNNCFPSELHFRRTNSMTTSGDSTWDLGSLRSLSSDTQCVAHGQSKQSRVLQGYETHCHAGDPVEISHAAKGDKNITLEDKNGSLCVNDDARGATVFTPARSTGTSSAPGSSPFVRQMEACRTNFVAQRLQPDVDSKCAKDAKHTYTRGKRSTNELPQSPKKAVAKSVLLSKKTVYKISNDFEEGRGDIRRMPHSANHSGAPKNRKAEVGVSQPPNVAIVNNSTGVEVAREKTTSPVASSGKFATRGKTGDLDSPSKKNSLRKLLRKTSKTLKSNIFDTARPKEPETSVKYKGKESRVASVETERQLGSKKKKSTAPSGTRTVKRDFNMVAKSCNEAHPPNLAFAALRENNDDDVHAESRSEEGINTSLQNDIMKHALNVELYLDELASP